LLILAKLTPEQARELAGRYSLDREAQQCITDSARVPSIAQEIIRQPDLKPSEMDKMIGHLGNENIIYLLLCIKNENDWERIVKYLDLKEKTRVEINGYDLIKMGMKSGPDFKAVLDELYRLKLDQQIKNRDDEINMVRQWIEEGRICRAMAD
jgi:tRNA nucleotidyltransferase (CCA-adding enzyme)